MGDPTSRQPFWQRWMNPAAGPALRPPRVQRQPTSQPRRAPPPPTSPQTPLQPESPPQTKPSSTEQTNLISSRTPPSPSRTSSRSQPPSRSASQQPSPIPANSQPKSRRDTSPANNADQPQPLQRTGSKASSSLSRPGYRPPPSRTPSPKSQPSIRIASRPPSPLNVASQKQPETQNDTTNPSPNTETSQPQIKPGSPSKPTSQPTPSPLQVEPISQSEPANQPAPPPQAPPPQSENEFPELPSQPNKPETQEVSGTEKQIPDTPTSQITNTAIQPENPATPTSGNQLEMSIPENPVAPPNPPQEKRATDGEEKQETKHDAQCHEQPKTKEADEQKQGTDATPPDANTDSGVQQGIPNSAEPEKERRRSETLMINNNKEAARYGSNGKERKVEIGTIRGASASNGERGTMQKDIKENLLKHIQGLTSNTSKHPMMNEYISSIITLSGENRGASMHVGSDAGKRDGIVPIHRGYKLNDDNENKGEPAHASDAAPPTITACINNNVQSVNNSILHNSSCSGKNSGVHLVLSRNYAEPVKQKGREESMSSMEGRHNSNPCRKLASEPIVRRRCLRGLFNEPSDSDPENPQKPRRHGCRFNPAGKSCNE
ncbi:hypothetical protein QJS10_CPA01g01183 [Acorus calamus]|uniref:Uncharacterized protein n=1 Tax=Acorus calamus TaxID=4465 RepID=A0AAV9FJY4_ACOCL|nr:hypothetical protein QJS10_CPA01g01183 [Acorus calamus]